MATPVLRAIEWDGTSWDDPSDEQLHDLLADMSLTWRFVVVQRLDLEPVGQHYMQVYLNDDLSYQVEYRDGGPDWLTAHVPRTHAVFAVEPVARLLQDWAHDRPGWREALPWAKWTAAEPGERRAGG